VEQFSSKWWLGYLKVTLAVFKACRFYLPGPCNFQASNVYFVCFRITSGYENHLFHFVYMDGNEGVVITPGVDTTPPTSLMAKFTSAAHSIHGQLQHNVRFRATQDPQGTINKSLIAVKECGILLGPEDDGKFYWVVGYVFLFLLSP